ncbi:hypothetical protein Dhaf_4729 [Desulfitobacterium hafniense DCB-2]|uniref:Uncharacterized protein n=1 Tax=Desulfitobacterium hafniense (strain DSM 10664 / DCB-2) TaxID=272564 RepID=B8FYX2_DESHD|nr:hypothetical protein Dhaf_4729 [Desulfitobacterium hafniense DCB-2]
MCCLSIDEPGHEKGQKNAKEGLCKTLFGKIQGEVGEVVKVISNEIKDWVLKSPLLLLRSGGR